MDESNVDCDGKVGLLQVPGARPPFICLYVGLNMYVFTLVKWSILSTLLLNNEKFFLHLLMMLDVSEKEKAKKQKFNPRYWT